MIEKEFVTFRLAGRLFGVEAEGVQDVFHPRQITRIPLAPAEILGILNLRGRIVTAICLRQKLAAGDRPAGAPEPKALGVEVQGDAYGLVVDDVEGVLKLSEADMIPPPDNLPPRWRDVVRGVHRLPDELLVLFDLKRLLHADQASTPGVAA